MAKQKTLSFLNKSEVIENKSYDEETDTLRKKSTSNRQPFSQTENISTQKNIQVEENYTVTDESISEDMSSSIEEYIETEEESTKTGAPNCAEEKVTSFLKKKISKTGNDKVKIALYLPVEYQKMNELATKTYDFASKSDFVTKIFASIIDNGQIPDLRELYLLASEKANPNKITKSSSNKSKYKYLERFLPNEKRKMKSECYMIYERHLTLLTEFAEEHHTTISKIVCNMYDVMSS